MALRSHSQHSTIAVVFDFDDTLMPDSTTRLLQEHGIDIEKFWKKDVKNLVSSGFDPPLAYLNLLLENIGSGKPLGNLTSKDLKKFGAKLDRHFYPGIPEVFVDLKKMVRQFKNISIEFYVISGGLQDIIEGSRIIKKHFSGVYACRLAGEKNGGAIKSIMRCGTFTEKTRFLFEINKGLDPATTQKNPHLVNSLIPENERPIPFQNMIYIGDGYTDIPCFSLIQKNGGTAFGVFNPEEEGSAKRAFLDFLKTKRVISMHAPKYGKKDDLGALLRTAVATIGAGIALNREKASKEY
ncbi:MAG: haloacid dehalogenase-like hydrolase [bacterium]|nr:haloacid dehalogenase-like hydrolase [bacterium]